MSKQTQSYPNVDEQYKRTLLTQVRLSINNYTITMSIENVLYIRTYIMLSLLFPRRINNNNVLLAMFFFLFQRLI